jgi:hypothetical protein
VPRDVGDVLLDTLLAAGVHNIKVRSVLHLRVRFRWVPLARDRQARRHREAVGIIAAQSIGEPGSSPCAPSTLVWHPRMTPRVCRVTGVVLEARTPRVRASPSRGRRSHHHRGHGPQPLILTPDNGDDRLPVLKRYPPRRGRPARRARAEAACRRDRPEGSSSGSWCPRCAEITSSAGVSVASTARSVPIQTHKHYREVVR